MLSRSRPQICKVAVCAIIALLICGSADADGARPDAMAMSTVRVCNKAGEKVSVALSYRGGEESEYYIVRGWFNLDDGECMSQRVVSGAIYAYGASDTGTWEGAFPICIERQQFMRMRTPNYTCGADDFKNFKEMKVAKGTLTYNLLDDDSDDDEEEQGD